MCGGKGMKGKGLCNVLQPLYLLNRGFTFLQLLQKSK